MANSTNLDGSHKCDLFLPTLVPSAVPMFSSSPCFRTQSHKGLWRHIVLRS